MSRVGSGWVGMSRIGSGRVGSGRVGSVRVGLAQEMLRVKLRLRVVGVRLFTDFHIPSGGDIASDIASGTMTNISWTHLLRGCKLLGLQKLAS